MAHINYIKESPIFDKTIKSFIYWKKMNDQLPEYSQLYNECYDIWCALVTIYEGNE
jgi:hypothetical protein